MYIAMVVPIMSTCGKWLISLEPKDQSIQLD